MRSDQQRIMQSRLSTRNILFLLLLSLVIGNCVCVQPAYTEPALSWNFSQGSLGGSRIENGNEIHLQLASTEDPWFFFRIDGVKNQTYLFIFDSVSPNHFGGWYLPAVSYDQTHWTYCKNITVLPLESKDKVQFTFEITFPDERAWIAYSPPYPNSQLDQFNALLTENPLVKIEPLCESPNKKITTPIITVTNPDVPEDTKNRIMILSREGGNDSASTWMNAGIIRFLLSDDPAAQAILRRCILYSIPIFDRDAVEMGLSRHPINATETVNWKSTWNEKDYSFYEQRIVKTWMQQLKDNNKRIDLLIRLQSSGSGQDRIHRETVAKEKEPAQDQLTVEFIEKKYLPWFANIERQPAEGTFSETAHGLFPDALTAAIDAGYVYQETFGLNFSFPKTTDDLMAEASLLMYAVAEALGVPASDPPPYLHAAEVYRMDGNSIPAFHVRCVYRDLQNRPPQFVRVVINGNEYELKPAGIEPLDYQQGVLYTGFIELETRINNHYFTASNGSKEIRIPEQGARPGPFSVPVINR